MLKTPKLRFKDKNGNAYPEWSSKQFDEVFEILQNNTFSRKELNYSNKSVKNIHYGDILINYPVNLNCQTCEIPNINQDINLSKYKSSSYLQNGDVIFADTAEDETVGKACEICNIQEKILSGLHTIPCRPKFNFASQYLGYFLNSSLYHNQLLPLITGIKVSSISKSSIKTTMIYYPCFEEQEKIAGFLSKVDELINECEGEVKDLEEQKKGLLQKIFSQQIRFKDSDNNPYPDWEEKVMDDILNEYCKKNYISNQYPVLTSSRQGLMLQTEYYSGENRITEKNNIGFNIIPPNYITYRSRSDDGLFTFNMNTLGITGIVSTYYPVFSTNCNNLFVTTYLNINKNNLFKYAVGSSQKVLSLNELKKVKIHLPCAEEQEKIAEVLSKMDELIEEKKALLSDWKQFKKGLLQQMFV